MTSAQTHAAPGAPGALAAPAGGAGVFGRLCRGCDLICFAASKLVTAALLSTVVLTGGAIPAKAQMFLGSGLDVAFYDKIDEQPVYRMRYLAPELADMAIDYQTVADDMMALCSDDALSRLTVEGATPERIIVTLMAAPVEFGVMTPDIRQFFESYTVKDGLCIWEAF